MTSPSRDAAIHEYLRAAPRFASDAERVGPFLAGFDRHGDSPFRNYAIPDDGAAPTPDEVAALSAAFVRRHRKPRLEYLSSLAPAVEAALVAGGFRAEGRLPIMTCTAGAEQSLTVPSGIELVLVQPSHEEELYACAAAQNEAYGAGLPTPSDVERLRATVASGGVVVLAHDAASGEAAGAGLSTAPVAGLTEIAAIGVRPAFRRRGVAGALTMRLAREAARVGATTVFLMAAHDAEARIYGRAGFRITSEMLHISR